MKTKTASLLVALVAMAFLGLLAGCGSGDGGATGYGAGITATTAGAAGVPGVTGTTVAGMTSTTVGGMTSTTAGGAPGVPTTITVWLTGAQEVPPIQTEGKATFVLILSTSPATGTGEPATTSGVGGDVLLPQGLRLSYRLILENVEEPSAAHIHLGAKGQNGEVIYSLFSGPPHEGSFTGILAEGPLDESDLTGPYRGKAFADLVGAVLQGETYVNIHTAGNPTGEMRGQIIVGIETAAPAPTTTVKSGGNGGTP